MPDFEFAAARIMHAFSGYTLEKLLAEPLEIFLQLTALADRALAHRTLEYPVIALNSPLRENDPVLENMRRRRGGVFRRRGGGDESRKPSAEKLRAALELAHRISSGQTAVSSVREYTPGKMIDANQKG